ncbi:MAG: alpha-amylase family glycosyl hydrolase [Bacilli bacterium]|nr:alpha-amylase family glycosyl hydrolase [Bacilli bacterium]
MKRTHLILFVLTSIVLTSCGGNSSSTGDTTTSSSITSSGTVTSLDPDDYDVWLNSWSKPGHLYFHYNRGEGAQDYNNYCLWLWQFFPKNLEGTLWGYDGPTQVSDKLTLRPMSTAFMTFPDVGLAGGGTYIDKYGIIFDVDLTRSDLVGGKTGTSVSFDGAEELGFLLPLQSSMDGKKNWTSDGGAETYIDDFANETNWRSVEGGKTIHIFTSTGDLSNYTYFAGSGTPQPKVNPVDSDTTGKFDSVTEAIPQCTAPTPTSDAFKNTKVGYQVFVASFRDSNGDGIGDIRGVIDSLDYFTDLGVDCLWLTPVQKSDSYHGYDISDYMDVDRRYGTLEDYSELIQKAHSKGIKVLMDLVLNHTSKTNTWFSKSKWAVNSGQPGTETDDTGIKWRNVYTWKYATDKIKKAKTHYDSALGKWVCDGYSEVTVKEDAESDNPSWYKDGESNYYYYGKFGSGMPEINYENKDTRKLVIDTAKQWLQFGLDGFRLDAVKHIYMKDEVNDTGDDIIVTDVGEKESFDDEKGKYVAKKYDYSSDLTKNVNWWREFSSSLKASYPNCFLVGENFDGWGTRTAQYYQALDSQFDFSNYYHVPAWILQDEKGAANYDAMQATETFIPFASSEEFEIGANRKAQGGCRGDFINGAFTSNHDVMRLINQADGRGNKDSTIANDNVAYNDPWINGRAKFQGAVTMLNPGLSWLYYGDELGMSSNTNKHIEKYGNENNMDIWYRQPFLWNDKASRPNYSSGQYAFELDDHNKHLLNNNEGIKYDPATGNVQTESTFYSWYKAINNFKKTYYPKGAKVEYQYSSYNVLRMSIRDESNNEKIVIYLNNGRDDSEYKINVEPGFNNVLALGGAPTVNGGNIGAVRFGLTIFMKG